MMQSTELFLPILQRWAEIAMRRSMRGFVLHSKELGVSIAQLSALMRMYRQGASTVSAVGEDLGISNAAASQLLERLVQHGLISRLEDPHDRRAKQIEILPKGRQVLEASLKARQHWLEDLAATLSPSEQAQVAAALQILIERAAQLDPLPPPAPGRENLP